jgi:4-hydroxybenzoate polyprenyltransferase
MKHQLFLLPSLVYGFVSLTTTMTMTMTMANMGGLSILLVASSSQIVDAFHYSILQRRYLYNSEFCDGTHHHRRHHLLDGKCSPVVVFYRDQESTATKGSTGRNRTNTKPRGNDNNENSGVDVSTTTTTTTTTSTSTAAVGSNLLHAGDIKWVMDDYRPTRRGQNNQQPLQRPRMRDHFSQLVSMTRPANLPGVVLFHALGTWLAYQSVVSAIEATAAATATATPSWIAVPAVSYWQLLLSPSMIVTLFALILTSATSMLVNDYYDYKLGNDDHKKYKMLSTTSGRAGNASSVLPPILVKRFTSYLYAMALFCVAYIPGALARCAVVSGLMLTFWYTQHLKPRTWLKNAVCAGLIAASPFTSGLSALSWLSQQYGVEGTFWSNTSLFRLFAIVFIGIMGREMTMDINDVEDDAAHNVRTVPVKYGRRFASTIGVVCSSCVLSLAVMEPLYEFLAGNVGRALGTRIAVRRLVMAAIGGLAQLRRSWQVYQTEGEDPLVVDAAVKEGLLSVVLIMASFV